MWYRSKDTHTIKNIQFKITEWINLIRTNIITCNSCLKDLNIRELEFSFPNSFLVTIENNKEIEKRINGVDKASNQLKLVNNVYELYAVICEYRYPNDKETSCYTLTLKGNNWYKFTKENIYKIDIETGKVLKSDVGAKNDKGNKQAREIETDDIMITNWIYYYRKIK